MEYALGILSDKELQQLFGSRGEHFLETLTKEGVTEVYQFHPKRLLFRNKPEVVAKEMVEHFRERCPRTAIVITRYDSAEECTAAGVRAVEAGATFYKSRQVYDKAVRAFREMKPTEYPKLGF